ncbi:MAG: hypothetical protein IJY21_04200 [Clostridia bacterium]|nr:hypothetical protein [Clostridia bacterium]
MKRRIATIYAAVQTLLLLAGLALVFFFAWKGATADLVWCLVGMALSVVFAPIFHEVGHVFAAWSVNMEIVLVKCFCFKLMRVQGKKSFRLVSPFAADETQVIPKTGGNMQKRAAKYTLGGLAVSGVVLLALVVIALLCTYLANTQFALWGALPYTAYLFLLNVLSLEYAGGKTDMLVFVGIKKGEPAERNMLAAMEIQGNIYAGKSFGELNESLYYDLPQLAEDEPLYAVMLDLRYRYHLEKGEYDRAADCLNRLALSQEYLPQEQILQIAVELTYMHAINGDIENAEESARLCSQSLQENTARAKRALLAYAIAAGNQEGITVLKEQATLAAGNEYPSGAAKSEKILLARLCNE